MVEKYSFDILVIGCGVAGLAAAIKAAEAGVRVGVVTREKDPKMSNTFWAQGGIIYPHLEDNSLVSDILSASSNTASIEACDLLKNEGGEILEDLLLKKAIVEFEKKSNGELEYTREAAHSLDRILYTGDFTGRSIQVSLLNYLKNKERFPNVEIIESHTAVDLITPNHHGVSIQQRYEADQVIGAYLLNQETSKVTKYLSKKTILATGGVGALYLHHSNAEGSRGDGLAMARRAGASLINMEFIQFHPTTLHDSSGHRRFLISEAIRGEGGILLNSKNEAFMESYHKDKELAPRDIVARSIASEMIKTNHDCVYLDISHKDSEWIQRRFPTIYAKCLEKKIDITKEPIPVVPAAHYTCGGIKVDSVGRSELRNLYAVGEVSCTGLHGANRLASTSLIEGLTWGALAGLDAVKESKEVNLYDGEVIKDWDHQEGLCDEALIQQDLLTIKQTMWNYVGISRTDERLKRAEAMFGELSYEIQKFYKNASLTDSLIGLRNAVEVSSYVLKASIRNQDSIGCFYKK